MTSSQFVSWLHIGDLHASDEDGWESIDTLTRIVAEVRAHIPRSALDFAFLPGDNANHGEPEQYRRIGEALSGLDMPRYAIPGDHDFESGSLDLYRRMPAITDAPASVRIGGRRALFLDIVSAGSGGPDFRLGAEQSAWLRAELMSARTQDEPRPIVFMHAFPGDLHEGAREIGRLFADARVAFVDTGHTHYNDLLNDGAVIYSATRSTGQVEEGPAGFAIVAVDGDVASWRFKPLRSSWPWVLITTPADERMAVNGVELDPSEAFEIHALVLGRSIVSVNGQIDDGPTFSMSPVEGRTALWTMTIGTRLDGVHRLRVTAIGADGASGTDEIRVLAPLEQRIVHSPGEDRNSVGAWPEHGLLGTRLGPNADGRDW